MLNEHVAENQGVPSTQDAATTPIDLAQAFKMLNQANREAANADVGDPEGGESLVDNTAEDGEGTVEDAVSTGEAAVESSDGFEESDSDGDGGGSSGGIEAIDFNAYKQDMLRDIQRNAAAQVRQEFAKDNIGYYSASELTVRDENTGQVRFRNPDVQDERDPDYYFKSRSDMQQFITAWNQGVDYEFRKAVNEKQNVLLQQALPTARLIDFMPTWQAMDQNTQNVFDALLEGHEVMGANGKPVGFNVDLNAVAKQAAKIAKNFRSAQPQADKDGAGVQNSGGPALDVKTGNGKSNDAKEPTSVGEALKMLDKMNKGGK